MSKEKESLKTDNIVTQTFDDLLFFDKIKIFILAKFGALYKIVETGKAKVTADTFKREDRTYIVSLDCCILDKDNTPMLFFDKNETNPIKPIQFKTPETKDEETGDYMNMSPKDLKRILDSKRLKDKMGSFNELYYLIAIICLIGVICAISFYSIYMQNNLGAQIGQLLKQIAELKAQIGDGGLIPLP